MGLLSTVCAACSSSRRKSDGKYVSKLALQLRRSLKESGTCQSNAGRASSLADMLLVVSIRGHPRQHVGNLLETADQNQGRFYTQNWLQTSEPLKLVQSLAWQVPQSR